MSHAKLHRPKYSSLAEELRLNAVVGINKELWDRYLESVLALHGQIRAASDMRGVATKSDQSYGVVAGEMVGIGHLLAVRIFSDNIRFSRAFSRCNWHLQDMNACCENFYWFGRFLFESVYFFGQSFDHNLFKVGPLYRVLRTHMVFESVAPTMFCPLPTCDSLEEAKAKIDEHGLVLSFVPKYRDTIDETKCVSTTEWSGRNADNEGFVCILDGSFAWFKS